MKTFEIEWTKVPFAHNPVNLLYVEAETKENAETVARDHIRRVLGVGTHVKLMVSEYEPLNPNLGRVLTGEQGRFPKHVSDDPWHWSNCGFDGPGGAD